MRRGVKVHLMLMEFQFTQNNSPIFVVVADHTDIANFRSKDELS